MTAPLWAVELLAAGAVASEVAGKVRLTIDLDPVDFDRLCAIGAHAEDAEEGEATEDGDADEEDHRFHPVQVAIDWEGRAA